MEDEFILMMITGNVSQYSKTLIIIAFLNIQNNFIFYICLYAIEVNMFHLVLVFCGATLPCLSIIPCILCLLETSRVVRSPV